MYLYEITRINLKFCIQRSLENEFSPEKKAGQLLKKKMKSGFWWTVTVEIVFGQFPGLSVTTSHSGFSMPSHFQLTEDQTPRSHLTWVLIYMEEGTPHNLNHLSQTVIKSRNKFLSCEVITFWMAVFQQFTYHITTVSSKIMDQSNYGWGSILMTFILISYSSVLCLVTELCPTLWTIAHQTPLSMGFSGKNTWSEWVAISFSRGSSWPRDWTPVSCVFCIAGRFFTHWAIGNCFLKGTPPPQGTVSY